MKLDEMSPDWVYECRKNSGQRSISELFRDDQGRARRFSLTTGGLHFDYSKTTLDDDSLNLLLDLARDRDVAAMRDRMFRGENVNNTEARPALHTALRDPHGDSLVVDGMDIRPAIVAGHRRVAHFAEMIRGGSVKSSKGRAYTDVVNIGIGGSDLGPRMAIAALAPLHDNPMVHFISNVDGSDFQDVTHRLDPASTLFLVASKSFRTSETMTNALTARDWLAAGSTGDVMADFVALTSAPGAAIEFGVETDRIFTMDESIGGRYSLWGCIGLPIMIAAGVDSFEAFLAGARDMDRHFLNAPLASNLPVILALTGIWNHQVCGHASRAVIPYEQRLDMLPAYLQQLEMESNGKCTTRSGRPTTANTIPVVWGSSGTNCQHSYFQMLHQGTGIVPCEFLVGARSADGRFDRHHRLLTANCLAQSEALMAGRDAARTRATLGDSISGMDVELMVSSRTFEGNRPSTTLIYDRLDPFVLGQILALYEHRTFVEGIILDINSFDQWGVELGKALADTLLPAVDNPTEAPSGFSSSTRTLLEYLHSRRDI